MPRGVPLRLFRLSMPLASPLFFFFLDETVVGGSYFRRVND